MTVLVDSDVLIEIARGRDQALAEQWRRAAHDEDIFLVCSPVTVAELWRSARPAEHRALTLLFDSLTCIPIDKETGKKAGEVMRQFSASHSIEIADALIGASALVQEAELWTRNRKHYPSKGLRFFDRNN